MFIAESLDAFKHRFVDSLRNMLLPDQAGAFILVLANSMQDESLRRALRDDIQRVFKPLRSNLHDRSISVTDDDLAVFQALERAGIESLASWQSVSKDTWALIFNPLRALRPARSSSQLFDVIERPFDHSGFNFNKPFLQPEILWQGRWQKTDTRVLYNKFPFAPYHLIIVPDPDKQLPQYLTVEHHRMMWQLLEQQQAVLPGFGAGYNSLGACASVNQLHFQSFMRPDLLPVERQQWRHNGGDALYPMNCVAFDSQQQCWSLIDHYHHKNQPYNLLYRPGRCYVLPRVPQGDKTVQPRVRGAGWIEACGVFNVADVSDLEVVTADVIHTCLQSLSVAGE